MNKTFWIGTGIVIFLVGIAILAPFLVQSSPYEIHLSKALNPADRVAWLGYDAMGGDVWSRLVYGARISLAVALLATLGSVTLGLLFGSIAGYWGGGWDVVLMRVCDVLFAFPGIVLAIALIAVFGAGLGNLVIALVVTGWAGYARLIRGEVMNIRTHDFVQSAEAIGVSWWGQWTRHIWPHLLAPISVQASFGMAVAVIAESSLSFLGLGVGPDTPSWGAMLKQGKEVLTQVPHLSIYPGAVIALLVLGFHLMGDGLREATDPKRISLKVKGVHW